jgi:uncharacterized protein (DUF488 family)
MHVHVRVVEFQVSLGKRSIRNQQAMTVFTIGHSTRPIDTFLEMLAGHQIQHLLDVRKIPRSRHNPQFADDRLAESLRDVHIRYTHMPGLGGLRRPRPDSINVGWRNSGFRGFADYMQTPAFEAALGECIEMARHERIVMMCAESVPWRCHRSLIADALLVRGIEVCEIGSSVRARPLVLTAWARVEGTHIVYAA